MQEIHLDRSDLNPCINRNQDGKEAQTEHLCPQCYNESLTVKVLALLKNLQWKAVVEKKAHRGRLWRMLGKDK